MPFGEDIRDKYDSIALNEAYEKYPDIKDYYERIIYLKGKIPPEIYNLILIETVQEEYHGKDRTIKLNGNQLDLLCRSLITAIRNMDSNAERDWHTYMLNNHEDLFIKLLRDIKYGSVLWTI